MMEILPVRQTVKDLGIRFPRASDLTAVRWLIMLPSAALAASVMSAGWAMIAYSMLSGIAQNVMFGIVTAGEIFVVLRLACAIAPFHHRLVRHVAAGTVILTCVAALCRLPVAADGRSSLAAACGAVTAAVAIVLWHRKGDERTPKYEPGVGFAILRWICLLPLPAFAAIPEIQCMNMLSAAFFVPTAIRSPASGWLATILFVALSVWIAPAYKRRVGFCLLALMIAGSLPDALLTTLAVGRAILQPISDFKDASASALEALRSPSAVRVAANICAFAMSFHVIRSVSTTTDADLRRRA